METYLWYIIGFSVFNTILLFLNLCFTLSTSDEINNLINKLYNKKKVVFMINILKKLFYKKNL